MALPKVEVEITADTQRAEAGFERVERGMRDVGNAADRASARTDNLGATMNRTSMRSGAFRSNIQNVSFQIQDFATQVGSGTSASIALGQQLPQLLGGFGAVGAVIGALAAVGIPALTFAFNSLRGETVDSEDALESLQDALDELIKAQELASLSSQDLADKFGSVNESIIEIIDAQRRLQERNLNEQFIGLVDALRGLSPELDAAVEATSRLDNAVRVFPAIENAVKKLPPELQNVARSISNFSNLSVDELNKAADQALQTALELEKLNDPAFDPIISQLLLFAERAQEYLGIVRDEARTTSNALARLGGVSVEGEGSEAIVAGQGAGMVGGLGGPAGLMGGRFNGVPLPDGGEIVNPLATGAGVGGGGGGGAQGNPALERLVETLKTQREIVEQWRAEGLELLNEANDQELDIIGGYNQAKLRLEEEYQRRLSRLKESGNKSMISETISAGKTILQAVGQTNEQAFKIAQAFGAAEVLVNAFVGASKELKEKGVIGIATAASVIAAGVGFVTSLKSIRPNSSTGSISGGAFGGGFGAPAAAAAPAAPSQPEVSRSVAIRLEGDTFGRDRVISLINEINEAVEDGAVVRLA